MLLCTGDRLRVVASSLNLPFRFHPMLLPCMANVAVAADPTTFLELHLEEMPAPGNRMMYLRRLSRDGE
jgi:hypothetical protein